MAAKARRSQATRSTDVFINCPFDDRFESLYLAYIAGLVGTGLTPRCVLEIPSGGSSRLERLFGLLADCRWSVHDLSCVTLDARAPRVPRFNMPFELGLAAALRLTGSHRWFVFEAQAHRIQKSISDINGIDPLIHGGSARGVLREITNAFDRAHLQPTPEQLEAVYGDLRRAAADLKAQYRSASLFTPTLFRRLVIAAQALTKSLGLLAP